MAGPSTQRTVVSPSAATNGPDMMNAVHMMTSPVDSFRPQTLPSINENQGAGQMPQPQQQQPPPPPPPQQPTPVGNRLWYEQSLGQSNSSSSSGAVPENFSWSALVEGMLDPLHSSGTPQSGNQDFSWLNNHAASTPAAPASMSLPAPTPGPAAASNSPGQGGSQDAARIAATSQSPSTVTGAQSNSMDEHITPYSEWPWNRLGADLLTTTDYTFGYSRLRTYTNELGDPTFKARVSAATDRFKPILHSCLSQYSDDQNIQAEIQFVSFVRQWQSLSDALPVPALVWRRTGDINGGNTRMARLLDVPLDNLRSGKLCIYHVSHHLPAGWSR